MVRIKSSMLISGSVAMIALAGCNNQHYHNNAHTASKPQAKRIALLESELHATQTENQVLRASSRSFDATTSETTADLPPAAKPGECYARVLLPARYKKQLKKILDRSAGQQVQVKPARYRTVTKRVLVQEASERVEVVPPRYKTITQRIKVSDGQETLHTIPATYKTLRKRVLVKPAHTAWKRGRGPVERIDNATGEIMCLVEVPAEYKTVDQRVIDKPTHTFKKKTPPQYKTITKRVVVQPAQTRRIKIPAQYKMVQVREMMEPPKQRQLRTAPRYKTIETRVKTGEERLVWRPILCETNINNTIIKQIQSALKERGFFKGEINGILEKDTLNALEAYQHRYGLASGNLTTETLDHLGISR